MSVLQVYIIMFATLTLLKCNDSASRLTLKIASESFPRSTWRNTDVSQLLAETTHKLFWNRPCLSPTKMLRHLLIPLSTHYVHITAPPLLSHSQGSQPVYVNHPSQSLMILWHGVCLPMSTPNTPTISALTPTFPHSHHLALPLPHPHILVPQ